MVLIVRARLFGSEENLRNTDTVTTLVRSQSLLVPNELEKKERLKERSEHHHKLTFINAEDQSFFVNQKVRFPQNQFLRLDSDDFFWDDDFRSDSKGFCGDNGSLDLSGNSCPDSPLSKASSIEKLDSPQSSGGGNRLFSKVVSAVLAIAAALFTLRALQIGYRIFARNYGGFSEKWRFPFSINSSLWHHLGNGNPRLYLRSVYQWCKGNRSST